MISFLSWVKHNKSDYWFQPWNTTQIPWHVFWLPLLFLSHMLENKTNVQSENTAGRFVATHKTSHNELIFLFYFLQAWGDG